MRAQLFADGGEITVGRRTASYVYGAFQVRLPDDVLEAENPEQIQDGYVYRPDELPSGRFDLAFVRADVENDLNTQRSTLEYSIDTAIKRTEGDVFFEREISGRGLGRYRPGIDYDLGDLVDVRIWGTSIALPVTKIEMSTDTQSPSGWKVHVGGQLIYDAEALRANNDQLQQQIEQERREQAKRIKVAQDRAVAANVTASSARGVADGARVLATDAKHLAQRTQERIDAEQNKNIKELAAQNAAMAVYFEAIDESILQISEYSKTAAYAGLSIAFSNGVIQMTFQPTNYIHSVSCGVIVRASALVNHSYTRRYLFTASQNSATIEAAWAESTDSALFFIKPHANFTRILSHERTTRGLQ